MLLHVVLWMNRERHPTPYHILYAYCKQALSFALTLFNSQSIVLSMYLFISIV